MSVNDGVIKLPSAKTETEVETVPLFELDDKVYEIPKNPPAGISLEYLEIATEQGQDAAAYYMLTRMLGKPAYKALKEHPTLTKDQFEAVFNRVESRVLGGDEEGNDE